MRSTPNREPATSNQEPITRNQYPITNMALEKSGLGKHLGKWRNARWHSSDLRAQHPKKAANTNMRGKRYLGISAPLRHLFVTLIQRAGDNSTHPQGCAFRFAAFRKKAQLSGKQLLSLCDAHFERV